MASTISTMAMLKTPKLFNPFKSTPKTPFLNLSMLKTVKTETETSKKNLVIGAGTALAGVIFSTLSASDAAFATQQIATLADGDNRGLALLLPLIPAIVWVLYNILQPALNQINKMRSSNGLVVGLGLGSLSGLAGLGLLHTPEALAAEVANDNRGQLLLFVLAPAILWVLYNILQPALNQINKMRS